MATCLSGRTGCTDGQVFFFFSSRRRHTRCSRDWSSDVCSSDLGIEVTRQLPGRDAVEPLHFLLLSQLEKVVGIPLATAALLPAAALLTRRVGTADTAALARNLAGSLEAEFDASSTGEFFDGTTGSHAQAIPRYTALSNLSEFDP